jgi:hypothetical protein
MDTKMDIKVEYPCKVCNKYYSSYKSLWNHNKKFHNTTLHLTTSNSLNFTSNSLNFTSNSLNFECIFCNKIFNRKDNLQRHNKTCKLISNNKINKIEQLEEKNKELENTIKEIKKQFSLILKEKGKIHHKTLQKINNQLNNTINNSNNNINHGNIINNTFVKFGELEYQKVLNNSQIKQILNKQYQSLEESIKQIHFNEELPEYSNIFITNMKDDLAYIFNGKQFISVRKNEMIHELIDIHTKEINLSLEKNKNKLNEKYVLRLEKFLDMLNDDDTQFTDNDNERIYPSYKAYKTNSLKLLIYNESDKKKLELLNTIELKEKIDDLELLE